jgi:hypothetical protein
MENTVHNIRTNRRNPRKLVRILFVAIIGVLFAIVFSLLFGFIVMKLWNWLMPTIFGLPTISYLQAFGITILAKILFSGIHGPHPKADHIHRKVDRRWHRWMGFGDVDNPWNSECSDSYDEFSHEDMKHYRDFWHEEGRQAFREYLARRLRGNGDND